MKQRVIASAAELTAKTAELEAAKNGLVVTQLTIEKLKARLRKGAARTVTALTKLVGRSTKAIAPSECASYFRHAGYRA